ncbi:uncharacterized protein LOC114476343 [Gouania willdenowi]|uniref:uncharacterized protein LOC114476343 n=1 Tax=Gouania willdenowi TaxID=441366 RepID=UPI001054A17F|nr:uncharacterized protein LOC114476343 [Gouania willdenowi]
MSQSSNWTVPWRTQNATGWDYRMADSGAKPDQSRGAVVTFPVETPGLSMLIQVRYCQQQKYVKVNDVDGQFDFMEFHEKGFSDSSLSSPSEWSESSFSSSASTILLDEVPRKKSRVEGIINAASAKKLIETLLETSSGGKEVLEEYHTTQTLTDATRRKLVNIIVAHMIDKHGHIPTKAVREEYALGIVTLFPSLKDLYSKKGYVNQDFTLLFDDEVSTRLLQKWDPIFRSNVIKEAKQLTSTPELRELVQSAESQPGSDEATTYDKEMASLLLLLYLLPPPPGGPKSPKISASDAVKKTCRLSQVLLQFGGASSESAVPAAIPPSRWSPEEEHRQLLHLHGQTSHPLPGKPFHWGI